MRAAHIHTDLQKQLANFPNAAVEAAAGAVDAAAAAPVLVPPPAGPPPPAGSGPPPRSSPPARSHCNKVSSRRHTPHEHGHEHVCTSGVEATCASVHARDKVLRCYVLCGGMWRVVEEGEGEALAGHPCIHAFIWAWARDQVTHLLRLIISVCTPYRLRTSSSTDRHFASRAACAHDQG